MSNGYRSANITRFTLSYLRALLRATLYSRLYTADFYTADSLSSISEHRIAISTLKQLLSMRMRQHTSAYVSIRQHTSAYVRIRPGHAHAHARPLIKLINVYQKYHFWYTLGAKGLTQ